jgi:hypothetical protein
MLGDRLLATAGRLFVIAYTRRGAVDEDHLRPQGERRVEGPVWRGPKHASKRREPSPGGAPATLGSR